jgi:hypothetical protein
MCLNNIITQTQTQSCSLSRWLGSEEWLILSSIFCGILFAVNCFQQQDAKLSHSSEDYFQKIKNILHFAE